MHELGITQSIVEIVSEQAGQAHVNRVTLQIGKLSGVVPDAIRFCFDVCAEGTVLQGSELEIVETPGRGRCRDCGLEQDIGDWFTSCACGSDSLDCIAGEELKIKSMEVV
jgi:hydrogenase nickel incorporation protein HypA/HybF